MATTQDGHGSAAGEAATAHAALIYGSDEELLGVAVPYLEEGIAAGEPTLLRIERRARDLIVDALGSDDGLALIDADAGKALEALREHRDRYARLAEQGHHRVRVLGQPRQEPWRDWARFEALVNPFYAGLPLINLCVYDSRATPADVAEDVRLTHTHVAEAGAMLVPNPRYRDPATFLAARARHDVDPAERGPPALLLRGPTPSQARHAVQAMASETPLSFDSVNALALSAGEVTRNAHEHGRPPVELSGWVAEDRVVVAVKDRGSGPAFPDLALVPGGHSGQGTLGLVYQAVTHVAVASAPEGFTVRMVMSFGEG